MSLPTKEEACELLEEHVKDTYQRLHAQMVACAVAGYARLFGEDEQLWWLSGYLHDIDYDEHPTEHPGPSLAWFKTWQLPEALIHAVEAHANGFNGFTTKPETKLAKTLIACDEISGIFYAYRKMNPIPYDQMKRSSIIKKINDTRFAPGIDRKHIQHACEELGVTIEEHVDNLIGFFGALNDVTI